MLSATREHWPQSMHQHHTCAVKVVGGGEHYATCHSRRIRFYAGKSLLLVALGPIGKAYAKQAARARQYVFSLNRFATQLTTGLDDLCREIGLRSPNFRCIRLSVQRPNVHTAITELTHSSNGD